MGINLPTVRQIMMTVGLTAAFVIIGIIYLNIA